MVHDPFLDLSKKTQNPFLDLDFPKKRTLRKHMARASPQRLMGHLPKIRKNNML